SIRDFHVTGVQTCALPILDGRFPAHTIPCRRARPCERRRMAAWRPAERLLREPERLVQYEDRFGIDAFRPTGARCLADRKNRPRSEERRVGQEVKTSESL